MGIGVFISLLFFATSTLATQKFDPKFMFGLASAAVQVEGAWDEEGKGESMWDYFAHHNSSLFVDQATPDVACDSYHKWREDVELLKEMGVAHYRFSLSWPRLLPTGFDNQINMQAVEYYQNLIAELKKNKIEPMVTLYHWDLPVSIHQLGGWANPKIVEYFTNYVKIVAEYFPDVVYWNTINEPDQVCSWGYGTGTMAPFLKQSGTLNYLCAYHLVKAHAEAYHILKNMNSNVQVGMPVHFPWAQPYRYINEDLEAAERYRQFTFGLYTHPIFKGGWPSAVAERVQERSDNENRTASRLPRFTKQEKLRIHGTADFVGINYYTTTLILDSEESLDYTKPSYAKDVRVSLKRDDTWETGFGGMKIVPDGLFDLLLWTRRAYGDVPIMITENGLADMEEGLNDTQRSYFIVNHLQSIANAIDMGIKVIGYTHWSLMDNFEWTRGYSARYGLYSVNFTDPERPRTPKDSVDLYKRIISERTLPVLPTTLRPTTPPIPITSTTERGSATTIKSTSMGLSVLLCIYTILNLV